MRPLSFFAIAVSAAAAVFATAFVPAQAQDGYGAGPGFSADIGGAVGIKPKYEGSDEYEVFGFPVVFPDFGGGGLGDRVTVRGADDVRFRLVEFSGFELGPLAGYAFGRDEDDGDLLRGLGDVDDGLVLGAYAGYRFGPVLLDVSYHQIVTGDDDGYQIRFGGSLEQELRPGFIGTLRVGATYADDVYMRSYFGISGVQALNSVAGLSAYDAEAGIKDVHVELGAKYELTERITLKATGQYARLVGDAADSPIVESEDQFIGVLGATYRFDFQR